MAVHRNDNTSKDGRSLRDRLLTGILLAWIVFVHLVYYWNFVQTYSDAVLKRIGLWLP